MEYYNGKIKGRGRHSNKGRDKQVRRHKSINQTDGGERTANKKTQKEEAPK